MSAVDLPHLRATEALARPGRPALDAVAWLSAHLAAVDHVIHPVARGIRPGTAAVLRRQRAVDHHLHDALWLLDRRLTGDVNTARTPVETMLTGVRARLAEHVAVERELLEAVTSVLPEGLQRDLADRLAGAMLRAPTRPHPFTPHVGLGGRLAFVVDGLLDRVRDGLDSRPVPTPTRARTPPAGSRWGPYFPRD